MVLVVDIIEGASKSRLRRYVFRDWSIIIDTHVVHITWYTQFIRLSRYQLGFNWLDFSQFDPTTPGTSSVLSSCFIADAKLIPLACYIL